MTTKEAYGTMSKALKAARRPIIFSLCEWGNSQPWLWAKDVGQLWRTTGDINAIFDGIKSYGNWHANGVMTIVDMQDSLYQYAGPGHWNDPDMLEVGNGMSAAEDRSHFSIWCMLAAPLMAGNDIRKMSDQTISVLTNKDAIAVDQDSAGMQAFRYSDKDSVQIWFRPLQNGDWAACFINRSSIVKSISFDWKKEFVSNFFFNRQIESFMTTYKLYDIWDGRENGSTGNRLSTALAAHDVLFLRLRK